MRTFQNRPLRSLILPSAASRDGTEKLVREKMIIKVCEFLECGIEYLLVYVADEE